MVYRNTDEPEFTTGRCLVKAAVAVRTSVPVSCWTCAGYRVSFKLRNDGETEPADETMGVKASRSPPPCVGIGSKPEMPAYELFVGLAAQMKELTMLGTS
jgi:hypothetical protein